MPTRVTALVPAWNSESFIGRTLDSLASQTYPSLRVLISDDASTDGTAEICEHLAGRDARFSVIRQPANLGWIGNANFLLARAESEYCFFGFHDDIFAPDYVLQLARRLDGNQKAAIAYSDLHVMDPSGRCRAATYARYDGVGDPVERARIVILREDDWWLPIHGLYRTAAVRDAGFLRRHILGEFSADWSWLVRMALCGEFARTSLPLSTKVLRKESVAAQWAFPPRLWYSLAFSCAGGVLGARLRARDKLILWQELAKFCRSCRREAKGLER